MQMPELYKVSGAVFSAILVVMGLNILADSIYSAERPGKPGYEIEIVTAAPSSDGNEAAKPAYEPSLAMIAAASVDDGIKVAKKCSACHTYEEGDKHKVGPNLWNIVNRNIGGEDGFKYSPAMSGLSGTKTWTYEDLDGFLAKPKAYLKGTAMGFAGLKKAKDRAAILAYLRSLSASPAPLPGE